MATQEQIKAKAKAKALQAKADAKAAKAAAAKPKTPGSNVKVIPAGSKPLTQRTTQAARRAENQRIAAAQSRMQAIKAQAALPLGHRDSIDAFKDVSRKTAGIAGKSGAKVTAIYKPMGGSGLGLLSIKNK